MSNKGYMRILAIDPGSKKTGYVVWSNDPEYVFNTEKNGYLTVFPGWTIRDKGKISNNEMLSYIEECTSCSHFVIENMEGRNVTVGATVFDTVRWTGQFQDRIFTSHLRIAELVFRRYVKIHLCGKSTADDAAVRKALIERFGDKGTKDNQGFTYGMANDMWQAFALAVFHADMLLSKGE